MAVARIFLSQARRLPSSCASCGEPASGTKAETYEWSPWWAQVILVLGHLCLGFGASSHRQLTLEMPFCDYHLRRERRAFAAFLTWLLVAFAGGAAAYAVRDSHEPAAIGLAGFAFAALVIGGVSAVCLSADGIKAKRIDDQAITLKGVCEQFAAAVDEDAQALTRRQGGRPWNKNLQNTVTSVHK